jgi:hypothetical protein
VPTTPLLFSIIFCLFLENRLIFKSSSDEPWAAFSVINQTNLHLFVEHVSRPGSDKFRLRDRAVCLSCAKNQLMKEI